MTTASLKTAFDLASELPEAEQDRLARELIERLGPQTASATAATEGFLSRLDTDPAFRERIEAALEEGEKDVAAGRVDDLETSFERIETMARDRGA